tara:strand:+ start:656 stop:2176 length:1521 start_codon:yes stop_codon:yes gene_type:complete
MYIDNIKDIVQLLNTDDKKEFRSFINRQRSRKNRKDLELFDILCETGSYPAKEIVKRLYKELNMNAYHAIRKRLLRHLTDFIIVKRIDEDTTSASSIMGLLTLSRFLFDNGNERVGWIYLIKSEQLANNNEQFDLLDNILNIQIENANSEHAPKVDVIIGKWKTNKQLADEDERANIANAILKIKLDEHRLEGKPIEIEKEVTKVMYEYDLYNAALKRPKIIHNLLTIVRSSVLAKKEYYKFEPLVIDSFNQIENSVGFKKKDYFYKLNMLYMIAHILYRNKKFKESLKYLELFKKDIGKYGKAYSRVFYPKYLLLYATVQNIEGNVDESIRVIEDALSQNQNILSTENVLNMKINLGVYYFELENYRESNRIIYSIENSDKWLERKMGKEWILRKNLGEVLNLYERGNVEIALTRIKSFEKNYAELLSLPIYDRVGTFLKFIRVCIDKPYWVSSKEFNEKVNETLERWPIEQEDLIASSFYCWLKAKMLKKPFYYVMVESLQGRM